VNILQPDVAICGGVSELAFAAGRRCVPHCFSTGINLAVSLHWMSALGPENALVEYCLRPSPLIALHFRCDLHQNSIQIPEHSRPRRLALFKPRSSILQHLCQRAAIVVRNCDAKMIDSRPRSDGR
jgi:hypothetical protein